MASGGTTFEDIISDPAEGEIVIISIITIPLCLLATILRLVATKRSGRKFGWDDLFAILALVGFLGYAITPFVGVAIAGDLTDDQLATLAAKLSYIATPFFYINQLFAKGSLFVLYYRIFWSDRTFVRLCYTLATIHICWFITFFFMVIFLCNPISKWWDISGTQPGHCIDGNAFLVSEETINSLMDFALIALTVLVVRKLQTKQHTKAKLTFIFLIGGLSGVIGFVKIGLVYNTADDNGQENNTNAFWDLLQMATSIFCACAPMYKTLLPLQDVWRRLKTSVASWASRCRLYGSLPQSAKSSLEEGNNSGKQGGSSQPESGNWPRLVGGSQTQYTWSEVETVDIQLPVRHQIKGSQMETHTDIV